MLQKSKTEKILKETQRKEIEKETLIFFYRDMSCQQASRFITTNSSSNIINNNTITNANCRNLNNSNNKQNHNTLKGSLITRGVIQQEDPYVFTESVPTTPPILFNTQVITSKIDSN